MNQIKDINLGDFLSFKASDGFYRVLFCSSIQKSKSPYHFNFSVTTIKSKIKPNIKDIRSSHYYGKGNRNSFKFDESALKKMWELHPEIKPYYLGTYELLITRKSFISFRDKFELIDNLPILENLMQNGSGGMNASDLDVLDNFLVNRVQDFMKEQSQKKYSTEAILKFEYENKEHTDNNIYNSLWQRAKSKLNL